MGKWKHRVVAPHDARGLAARGLSQVERFWIKVEKAGPDECWLWRASTSSGYGHFYLANHSRTYAHRYSYELMVGPIPDGLHIDHLCRNRACVNPAHLEPVTHVVNTLRGFGFSGINSRKTHCPRGHAYDAANTYVDRHGQRHCRACKRERQRIYKRAKRAAE